MAANGNNGNTSGQSAASAQAAAAAGNAAASNAANGNTSGSTSTSNTSGTSGDGKGNAGSTNTSSGASNAAGLMGSLMSFGNSITGNVGNTYGGGSGSGTANKTYSEMAKEMGYSEADIAKNDRMQSFIANVFTNAENARNNLPAEQVAAGDRAYTKARAEGKTEAEAQFAARDTMRGMITEGSSVPGFKSSYTIGAFKAKNIGPTYNPAETAKSNTNANIAAGSSKMGPSTPANNAPGNIGGETGGIVSAAAPTSVSDATNTGVTNRGSTVTNGGTSVTDSGTGGSISSSITPPSRDASSIGLGVYDADRANYDQDNWNRGMEVESSSLVSDEECKAFAKRAFMENSEPFKVVRTTILKKC